MSTDGSGPRASHYCGSRMISCFLDLRSEYHVALAVHEASSPVEWLMRGALHDVEYRYWYIFRYTANSI
jgi:hypothetical protein